MLSLPKLTDCPDASLGPEPTEEPSGTASQDLGNLKVGDSITRYNSLGEEGTTVTLARAETGVKASQYNQPDKGMTSLALFYTFEASDEGGTTSSVEAFSPDGEEYDRFYGAEGKYQKDWGYTDMRPGKSVQGWVVFEVPKKGDVEVVMQGYDANGEEIFATWVVQP